MYRFYTEAQNGEYTEEINLTKRQAVIRYNKACKQIGYELKQCGWELQ